MISYVLVYFLGVVITAVIVQYMAGRYNWNSTLGGICALIFLWPFAVLLCAPVYLCLKLLDLGETHREKAEEKAKGIAK